MVLLTMLNSDDIDKLDSQWSEHPFDQSEKIFYQGLSETFYYNPICFAGIFTGNDLYNLHETCLLKNYKVDAYDYYPYLNDNDKKVMQDYVIKRHSDKPYVNCCGSDVTKSTKQYSIIYNTAGHSCKIHELFEKQQSPCILLNSRGSSWNIHSKPFTFVFRSYNFDIFVNSNEAKNLFYNFLKDNSVKFKQLGFDLVKIDETLFGFLRHTNEYKKFIKRFTSTKATGLSL